MRSLLVVLAVLVAGCSGREAELQKQIGELEAKVKEQPRLQYDKEALTRRVDELVARNTKLQEELATAKTGGDAAQAAQTKAEAVETELAAVKAELAEAEAETEALRKQLVQVMARGAPQSASASAPAEAQAEVSKDVAGLQDRQKDLETRIAEVQARINMQRTQVSKLLRATVTAMGTRSDRRVVGNRWEPWGGSWRQVPVYETYSTPVVVRQGQFETEAKKQAAIEAARAPIAAMETEKARLQADLQKVTDELARLGVK